MDVVFQNVYKELVKYASSPRQQTGPKETGTSCNIGDLD